MHHLPGEATTSSKSFDNCKPLPFSLEGRPRLLLWIVINPELLLSFINYYNSLIDAWCVQKMAETTQSWHSIIFDCPEGRTTMRERTAKQIIITRSFEPDSAASTRSSLTMACYNQLFLEYMCMYDDSRRCLNIRLRNQTDEPNWWTKWKNCWKWITLSLINWPWCRIVCGQSSRSWRDWMQRFLQQYQTTSLRMRCRRRMIIRKGYKGCCYASRC